MKSKDSIVKTPIELQLQKINLFNVSQQKNIEMEYALLRLLVEIINNNPQIVNTSIFQAIFNQFTNYQQFQHVRMLPLFEIFSYRLWNNENFNIQIRQKTSFYRIVSNWIVNFQLRGGKFDKIISQFELIYNFMSKQTHSQLERMVMIEQTFEDLKDLLNQQFWNEQEQIVIQNGLKESLHKKNSGSPHKQQKQEQISEESLNTIYKIFEVLEAIIIPQYYKVKSKDKLYKTCTCGNLKFKNVSQFIKKAIYFTLNQPNIPSHLQTQLSKIALIHLQSLSHEQSQEIVNMLKHLMLKTSKAVRFALVIEYVEFYEYLQKLGYEAVIEQLQNMLYFRQLIIGKLIVEESIMDIGNAMNQLNLSYHELYIKAGTIKKVYFSSQINDCILKLDIFLEQNDVNIKICHYDSLVLEKKPSTHMNKFIFDAVNLFNQYDASKITGEKVYFQQDKSTSKKLQLRLQHQGLYSIQFDNTYSWVIPKNVKYRIQLYQSLN